MLNPTIIVYLVAKFSHKITIPNIRKGYDTKKNCNWVSLLGKVEHITYTMCAHALPDTVVPQLSKLVGPWVCSDNQKVQIINSKKYIKKL